MMEIRPIENGLTIVPETDFEREYMCEKFTANQKRKVSFNHDTGVLIIVQENEDELHNR